MECSLMQAKTLELPYRLHHIPTDTPIVSKKKLLMLPRRRGNIWIFNPLVPSLISAVRRKAWKVTSRLSDKDGKALWVISHMFRWDTEQGTQCEAVKYFEMTSKGHTEGPPVAVPPLFTTC